MLDRQTAARLNPIIATTGALETLENLADVLGDLATIQDSADHAGVPINRYDFLMLGARAALVYELETMRADVGKQVVG